MDHNSQKSLFMDFGQNLKVNISGDTISKASSRMY